MLAIEAAGRPPSLAQHPILQQVMGSNHRIPSSLEGEARDVSRMSIVGLAAFACRQKNTLRLLSLMPNVASQIPNPPLLTQASVVLRTESAFSKQQHVLAKASQCTSQSNIRSNRLFLVCKLLRKFVFVHIKLT